MYKVIIGGSEVDLYNQEELKTSFNYSISNINNLDVRKNSFSTTIKVPATNNNRITLGFPEDWNTASAVNQTVKPDAYVEKDGARIFIGFAKANAAIEQDNQIVTEYELELVGDNGVWRSGMLNLKLSDLDFSSDNHTLTKAHQELSETVSASRNYVYDFCNRGRFDGAFFSVDENGDLIEEPYFSVEVTDRYPAIPISVFLEKIYHNQGFRIVSNFKDSSFFQKLYWIFTNELFVNPPEWNDNQKFKALLNENQFIELPFGQQPGFIHLLDINDTSSPGFPPTQSYPQITPLYSNDFAIRSSGKYRFQLELSAQVVQSTVGTTGTIYFTIRVDNLQPPYNGIRDGLIVFQKAKTWIPASGFSIDEETELLDLKYGDNLYVTCELFLENTGQVNASSPKPRLRINEGARFEMVEVNGVFALQENHYVDMNRNLPDVLQIDFIKGLKQLFNLYFYTDVENRVVYIEPRDQFYSSTAKDWTDKLDTKKQITTSYIGDSYGKTIRYRYKEDGSDGFVAQYEKQEKKVLASHDESMANKFSKDEIQDFENELFAPTYMESCEIIGLKTAKIPKLWASADLPNKKTGFEPRILYYDGVKALPAGEFWAYGFEPNLADRRDDYPRFLSYDDTEVNEKNLFFNNNGLSYGLFHKFYRNTHKIIDDSRIIKDYLFVSEVDINNLDLREPIYLKKEGSEAAFIINSINDYDPDSHESTEFELIKIVGNAPIVQLTGEIEEFPIVQTPGSFGAEQQDSGIVQIQMGTQPLARVAPDGRLQSTDSDAEVYMENTIGDFIPVLSEDINGNLQPVTIRNG